VCKGQPFGGVQIEGRFARGDPQVRATAVKFGETETNGHLAIDVSHLEVPSAQCGLEGSPFGKRLDLLLNGTVFGHMDLEPVYRRWIAERRERDGELESSADRETAGCQARGDCGAVIRYLSTPTCYSDPEIRNRLSALVDDAVWDRSNVQECNSSAANSACDGVANYRNKFSSGRHVGDATQLLASWEKRRTDSLRKLDGWARTALTASWSTRLHTTSTCYNLVDVEVPCDGAAAVKKSDSSAMISQVSVRNSSRVPFTCGIGKSEMSLFGGKTTSDAAPLPPGSSHIFTEVDEGLGLFAAILGGGGNAHTVACMTSASALIGQVPSVASLMGGGEGQTVIAIVSSGNATAYAFATPDNRVFMLDGNSVQEVKGKD
jgi:hypothetical protein